MKLTGARTIAADRETVWAALNDAAVLKACIKGCHELEKTSDTSFEAVVKQKVGPVSATFKGAVQLSELNPPESYRISGEGKGGAAGFAKGGADVKLTAVSEADGGGTELAYDVDAKVGGKMAQLGSRLIDGFAKKMADQFFETFQTIVEGDPEESDTPADTSDKAPEEGAKKSWLKRFRD